MKFANPFRNDRIFEDTIIGILDREKLATSWPDGVGIGELGGIGLLGIELLWLEGLGDVVRRLGGVPGSEEVDEDGQDEGLEKGGEKDEKKTNERGRRK